MLNDYYDRQTYDYKITQGDTLNIPLKFYDKDNNAIVITALDATFTMRDPITNTPLTSLQKTHDDAQSGGDGIYYYGDTYLWSELGLSATNQLQIVLTAAETSDLDPGVYPFDLEFSATINSVTVRKTAIHGNIIVSKEHTEHA